MAEYGTSNRSELAAWTVVADTLTPSELVERNGYCIGSAADTTSDAGRGD